MRVGMNLDTRQFERLTKAVLRQTPYAMKEALNKTALTFQEVKRRDYHRTFTLRRASFIERQGVKVLNGFATKERPEITIGNDRKADFLAKFEAGGTKTPRGEHLAIPGNAIDKSKVIPRNMRPRALEIADGVAQGINVSRKRGTVTAGKVRRPGQGLRRTYLVPEVGIFQRRGKGAGSTSRLLYGFKRAARIDADLRFMERAREVMSKQFGKNFAQEFAKAIRSARV
jgi:hypothetical protein